MQSSKLPLQKWVFAMYLMSTNLKGVSSMKLHRDLGVTQKTAWMMAQKIRQGWIMDFKFSGTVEVDETYLGGKERNKHKTKKSHSGRGAVGKTAVAGVKNRETNQVSAAVIKGTSQRDLHGFIKDRVSEGSIVYTDDHGGYSSLWVDFKHKTVRHSIKEFVRSQAHTNGIESFWSMLKRGYHGTYHRMSSKHLDRYITEFAGRHNVRSLDTLEQMRILAKGMDGKRLRYLDLTA